MRNIVEPDPTLMKALGFTCSGVAEYKGKTYKCWDNEELSMYYDPTRCTRTQFAKQLKWSIASKALQKAYQNAHMFIE